MIRDIVAFEWRYHTRQISFVAAALLFFAFGSAMTARSFGPANVNVDSPYSVAQTVGVLSLFSLFVLAVFCANAVVRDREHRFEEIVFTTSVEKLPFLIGRFTGSFLAAFTAFSTSVLGMYLARFVPWHDADRIGSASPLPHLWALLVIALPNLFFAAVVLFALSTITRSVLASYAGSVLIWVLYFVAAAMSNSPLMASSTPAAEGGSSLAALLDPFALTAFFEQTRHWTPAVRNTRLVQLGGDFLVNRLVWVGVSLGILAIVAKVFSFRVPRGTPASSPAGRAASRRQGSETLPDQPPGRRRSAEVAPSAWTAYLSATKFELRAFLLSKPFVAMVLLWAGLIGFEMISEVTGGEYGSAVYPAAGILFAVIQQPLAIVAAILLIYTSAEIVWRERALRFAGILHATPAENAVFVAAKCTALAALVGLLTAVALGIGAVLQLAGGWPVDLAAFASFAYVAAMPLVLFGIAAIVIQTLSPHKYAGMFLVLVVAIATIGGDSIGLHPLAQFGGTVRAAFTEMNGFGRIAGFHWLTLYWTAISALLLLFAVSRWRGRRERVSRAAAFTLAAIAILTGAFIFRHTRPFDVLEWRAGYERRYAKFAALPQPRATAVTATIDVDP
ncbi:MAG TPA: ABC transporter permease, partial [Thermoanaerobaculia bacterium]|nr:ABC transporter permease [Thermoanaerobaculia bacterium]